MLLEVSIDKHNKDAIISAIKVRKLNYKILSSKSFSLKIAYKATQIHKSTSKISASSRKSPIK